MKLNENHHRIRVESGIKIPLSNLFHLWEKYYHET
mgnify:CR=1 FL=1